MSCQDVLSNPVELTVRPGGNVTLYCDCKSSQGEYVVWYRNCSHDNQPTLTLKWDADYQKMNYSHFVWNNSANSYNLVIENITDSVLGLYFCGTEKTAVINQGNEGNKEHIYRYGNVTTRISFGKLTFCVYFYILYIIKDGR